MRLSASQVAGIQSGIQFFLGAIKAKLYLYGSRADDSKKGGDIDLALVLTSEQDKTFLLSKKHLILSKIQSKIGDQKIDFKICSIQDLKTDPFLQMALEKNVQLPL